MSTSGVKMEDEPAKDENLLLCREHFKKTLWFTLFRLSLWRPLYLFPSSTPIQQVSFGRSFSVPDTRPKSEDKPPKKYTKSANLREGKAKAKTEDDAGDNKDSGDEEPSKYNQNGTLKRIAEVDIDKDDIIIIFPDGTEVQGSGKGTYRYGKGW